MNDAITPKKVSNGFPWSSNNDITNPVLQSGNTCKFWLMGLETRKGKGAITASLQLLSNKYKRNITNTLYHTLF